MIKIIVKNLPFQYDLNEFNLLFVKFKDFHHSDITIKNNKKIGILYFNNDESASDFINFTNYKNIYYNNRILRFFKINNSNFFNLNSSFYNKNLLFITNIPTYITPKKLKNIFESLSPIGLCYINTDINTGQHKQSGVVEIFDLNIYNNLIKQKNLNYDNITLSIYKFKI